MTRLGGITKRYYKETRGIKVGAGERVTAGTVLTRQGHHWKPGLNIIGVNHLTAACDGEVYFTHKRNKYKKIATIINIKPDGKNKKEVKK